MRNLLVALALAGMVAAGGMAEDAKEKKDKKDPSKEGKTAKLKVGDPAPKLEADAWLQGDKIKSFEAGKIYVVEFWATWCGPCIVMMPHVAELQEQYKDKGVTFIGFSAKDANNSRDKVAAFVKKRGPKLKYTFAYDDGRETHNAWMQASGQRGIPCCFVVDKAGKIAYIGHPMYLDVVLPRVTDGSWKGEESLEEVRKIEKDVTDVFGGLRNAEPDDALKSIKDFEQKHPALARIPYFVGPKINLLLQAKKTDEAKKMAQDVMQRAVKQDDPTMLRTISMILRSPAAKGNKDLLALSVKSAEALLEVSGDKDAFALFNMAQTHFAAGNKEKAREFGKKAVEAADSPALKGFLEKQAKAFDDRTEDKKEEKKKDDLN